MLGEKYTDKSPILRQILFKPVHVQLCPSNMEDPVVGRTKSYAFGYKIGITLLLW